MRSIWGGRGSTRIVTSTLGVLVGLAGIEHGIFEVLQGNVTPEGPMIEAIGPGQRFWEYGTETALTVVPSIFLSGILAICIGIPLTVWAGAFVERRHGTSILVLLSVTLWLVGGGFAPIFMTILAGLAGTRINGSLQLCVGGCSFSKFFGVGRSSFPATRYMMVLRYLGFLNP